MITNWLQNHKGNPSPKSPSDAIMSLYQVDRAPLRGPLSRQSTVQESPPGRSGSPGPAAGAAQPWPRCSPAASLAAVALRRRPLARRRRRRAVCLPGPPVAGCGGSSRRSAALLLRRGRAVGRRSTLVYRGSSVIDSAATMQRLSAPASPCQDRENAGPGARLRRCSIFARCGAPPKAQPQPLQPQRRRLRPSAKNAGNLYLEFQFLAASRQKF